jgi:hypothetical protein
MRHRLLADLADIRLKAMTDEEIILFCPPFYGDEVTYDHLNLVWDRLYDQMNTLSTMTLVLMWSVQGINKTA